MAAPPGRVLTLRAVLDIARLSGNDPMILNILQEYGYVTDDPDAQLGPAATMDLPVTTGQILPTISVAQIATFSQNNQEIMNILRLFGYFPGMASPVLSPTFSPVLTQTTMTPPLAAAAVPQIPLQSPPSISPPLSQASMSPSIYPVLSPITINPPTVGGAAAGTSPAVSANYFKRRLEDVQEGRVLNIANLNSNGFGACSQLLGPESRLIHIHGLAIVAPAGNGGLQQYEMALNMLILSEYLTHEQAGYYLDQFREAIGLPSIYAPTKSARKR